MDLVAVIDDVLEEVRLREPEPKIVLAAPEHLTIEGDPERLHQVLANLLDNAPGQGFDVYLNPPDKALCHTDHFVAQDKHLDRANHAHIHVTHIVD